MKASFKRHIKSGRSYDVYFSAPAFSNTTLKQHGDTEDSIRLVVQTVGQYHSDTSRLTSAVFAPLPTVGERLRALWQFVYEHIQYTPDMPGTEQVRRPARTWADRRRGVDCDCYAVFISSVLTNLKIPHSLRVAKYDNKPDWAHIYVIVPAATHPRGHYTLDPVLDTYDHEYPFTKHKDVPMEIQQLSGLPTPNSGLGNIFKKAWEGVKQASDWVSNELHNGSSWITNEANNFWNSLNNEVSNGVDALKKSGQQVANFLNKVNPVAIAGRELLLKVLRKNSFRYSERIRFAYLSASAAVPNYVGSQAGYDKLSKGRMRIEDTIEFLGGQKRDAARAVLHGDGNRDGKVSPNLAGINGLAGIEQELSDAALMEDPAVGVLVRNAPYGLRKSILEAARHARSRELNAIYGDDLSGPDDNFGTPQGQIAVPNWLILEDNTGLGLDPATIMMIGSMVNSAQDQGGSDGGTGSSTGSGGQGSQSSNPTQPMNVDANGVVQKVVDFLERILTGIFWGPKAKENLHDQQNITNIPAELRGEQEIMKIQNQNEDSRQAFKTKLSLLNTKTLVWGGVAITALLAGAWVAIRAFNKNKRRKAQLQTI